MTAEPKYYLFPNPVEDTELFEEISEADALQKCGMSEDEMIVVCHPRKYGGCRVSVLLDVGGEATIAPDFSLTLVSDWTDASVALLNVAMENV